MPDEIKDEEVIENEVPVLADDFVPSTESDTGITAEAAKGYHATLVRYDPWCMGNAKANGIHVVKYGQCTPEGEPLITNQETFSRTKEGYLLQHDCIIGIEKEHHYAMRAEVNNRMAREQLEQIIGKNVRLNQKATPSEALAAFMETVPKEQKVQVAAALKVAFRQQGETGK